MRLIVLIVAGGLACFALGMYWAVVEGRHHDREFLEACRQVPKSEAECKLLLSMRQASDDAAVMAAVSLAVSAANQSAK